MKKQRGTSAGARLWVLFLRDSIRSLRGNPELKKILIQEYDQAREVHELLNEETLGDEQRNS